MFPDLLCDDVFRQETARLWLRWPRAADADEIERLAGDADVACATAHIPHPYPAGAANAFVVQARQKNTAGKSAVFVLTAKRRPSMPLGVIGLNAIDVYKLSLGYWLGKPYWNQGLMTEAARAMVNLAFTWTSASEIVAASDVDNSASRRVLEKSGLQFVDRLLVELPARGAARLSNHFSLRRIHWSGFCGALTSVDPARPLL